MEGLTEQANAENNLPPEIAGLFNPNLPADIAGTPFRAIQSFWDGRISVELLANILSVYHNPKILHSKEQIQQAVLRHFSSPSEVDLEH